ncbi:MAG: RidA family protein [Deltaproteobacteria bacterium]|nr:RidA family protein [Deltaproteobacteria bacterium]
MEKKIISTKMAPGAIGPYSQAVRVGEMLYVSGQIPLDPETMEIVGDGIAEQTKQVMDNLMQILTASGADAKSVVKTTCFLSDMSNFASFNEVYGGYFKKDAPARACVEVSRLPKDVLVEVEAVAFLGQQK